DQRGAGPSTLIHTGLGRGVVLIPESLSFPSARPFMLPYGSGGLTIMSPNHGDPMLDPQLVQIARNRIELDFRERARQVAHALGALTQEMVSKGLLHSTIIQNRASTIISDEFTTRAELAW